MLEDIKWKKEYITGVEIMDKQHQQILVLMNEVINEFNVNSNSLFISELLNKLTNYLVFHFSTEQQLFTTTHYPASIKHIEEHQAFLNKIEMHVKNWKKGEKQSLSEMIFYFQNWINNHFIYEDKQYSSHFRRHLTFKNNSLINIS